MLIVVSNVRVLLGDEYQIYLWYRDGLGGGYKPYARPLVAFETKMAARNSKPDGLTENRVL